VKIRAGLPPNGGLEHLPLRQPTCSVKQNVHMTDMVEVKDYWQAVEHIYEPWFQNMQGIFFI